METSIDRTVHEVTGCTSLVVRSRRGNVTITHRTPVDGPDDGLARVRFVPEPGASLDHTRVTIENGILLVEVPERHEDRGRWGSFSLGPIVIGGAGQAVHIEIEVPGGIPVDVDSRFGNVTVEGTSADATVKAGAGNVKVDKCLTVAAAAGAGDVTIGSCTGGSATAGTGNVTIDSTEGSLNTRTGAGNVKVRESTGGEVSAATGAGDVKVTLLAGSCQCRSGAGAVTVTVPRGEPVWLDLNAGLGSVRKEIEPVGPPEEGQPHLSVRARTGLGDVTVRHP